MKLSVCMITYNQERFIEQAINSVLMQLVDFDYEIVIGDDCSTDNTKNILIDFQNKHPEKIKLLLNEQNKGVTNNFADTLRTCSGKYVALLEGDDYWTSPYKLQKQVDYLDNNPGIVTCYHSTRLIDRQGKAKLYIPRKEHKKPISELIDLIRYDSFMSTCSIVFRNKAFDYFPDVFFVWSSGCDWPLNVLNAEVGKIGYIDEVMSDYRSGSGEHSWTSKPLTEILTEAVRFNREFNKYFDYRYNKIFAEKISKFYYSISIDYLRQGYINRSLLAIRDSVKTNVDMTLIARYFLVAGPISYIRGRVYEYFPTAISFLRKLKHRL